MTAFSANTAWEVRPTNGSDLNGGGFVPANGTKTVTAATDLTIDATLSTKVTSAAHNFVAGDVNKWIMVTAGTGWIIGLYQIVSTASNAATLDRSPVTSIAAATGHSGTYDLYDGIDYSQQNAAQVVLDNSAITTSITTNVITFTGSTHATVLTEVGNYVHLASGTNITAGWWQITAVSAAANNGTWTVNANIPSSGTTTNAVGKMGGALQTLTTVASIYVGSNKIFVKAESTITTTVSFTFATSTTPSQTTPHHHLIGYTSSRTDSGRVSIALSTNTGLTAINCTGTGANVLNFDINCASLGTSQGIKVVQYSNVRNCKVSAFTLNGIIATNTQNSIIGNEVTTGTSAATSGINIANIGTTVYVLYNNVHDNQCTGILGSGAPSGSIIGNLITNNTGATSDGIVAGQYDTLVMFNTIFASGRDGIRINFANGVISSVFKNNLLVSNVGNGIMIGTAAGSQALATYDGNAYYNNGVNRKFMDDVGNAVAVNGVSPYTNVLDIILTADPFTNSAGGDFTLNNTAGGGAAVRGHGVPASIVAATGTCASDMGVFQHADPAGGVIAGQVF